MVQRRRGFLATLLMLEVTQWRLVLVSAASMPISAPLLLCVFALNSPEVHLANA